MLAGTIGERNVWRYDGAAAGRRVHRGGVHALRIRAAPADLRGVASAGQQYRIIPDRHLASAGDRPARRPLRHGVGMSRCERQRHRCRGAARTLSPVRRRPTGADDPLRRLRQRGAAVLPHRQHGQRRLCPGRQGARRQHRRDAGAGDDGLLLDREGKPDLSTADRDDVPGCRELHWLRRQPRVGADDDAGPPRVQGTDGRFRSSQRPRRPASPVSDGRTSGRSGKPAIRG